MGLSNGSQNKHTFYWIKDKQKVKKFSMSIINRAICWMSFNCHHNATYYFYICTWIVTVLLIVINHLCFSDQVWVTTKLIEEYKYVQFFRMYICTVCLVHNLVYRGLVQVSSCPLLELISTEDVFFIFSFVLKLQSSTFSATGTSFVILSVREARREFMEAKHSFNVCLLAKQYVELTHQQQNYFDWIIINMIGGKNNLFDVFFHP